MSFLFLLRDDICIQENIITSTDKTLLSSSDSNNIIINDNNENTESNHKCIKDIHNSNSNSNTINDDKDLFNLYINLSYLLFQNDIIQLNYIIKKLVLSNFEINKDTFFNFLGGIITLFIMSDLQIVIEHDSINIFKSFKKREDKLKKKRMNNFFENLLEKSIKIKKKFYISISNLPIKYQDDISRIKQICKNKDSINQKKHGNEEEEEYKTNSILTKKIVFKNIKVNYNKFDLLNHIILYIFDIIDNQTIKQITNNHLNPEYVIQTLEILLENIKVMLDEVMIQSEREWVNNIINFIRKNFSGKIFIERNLSLKTNFSEILKCSNLHSQNNHSLLSSCSICGTKNIFLVNK